MDFFEFKKYLKELFKLSFPILAGNLGQMFINLGDVYVAGHYNTNTLAAISVASAIFMSFIIAGLGLTSAITPVLSNYRGERRKIKEYLFSTLLFSQILSLIFFLLVWLLMPLIYKFGLNPAILNGVIEYLKISSFSIFGLFLFAGLKEFLQAYEIVKLPNALMIIAVFINFGLNYLFVYGCGVINEMGTAGLAVASLTVRTALGLILLISCLKFLNNNISVKNKKTYVKELVKIGYPIATAMFIEFLGFNMVAILVGKFASLYSACHNIVITITSITYMIPFSVSCALSVKIGFANGSRNIDEIKKYIQTAFSFVFVYSACVISFYLIFKEKIISIFSSDANVISLGATIIIMAACFTLFDAIQSICIGILKGIKKTLLVMIIDGVSYLGISIPLGILLAFKFNMLLEGFWIGLSFGIFTASVCAGSIVFRQYFKLKKEYQLPK